MPFIEAVIAERAAERTTALYVGKHPRDYRKSVVILPQAGCVFIGSPEQCNEYITQNSHRY